MTVHGSRIVLEIARALDIALGNYERPETGLHKYLYERQTLLILDNSEQLLGAAPVVSAMLAACPLVKIVVTSRAPLRVRGEQQFPVEALALPERVDDLNFRELVGYSAVQLFAERAGSITGFRTYCAERGRDGLRPTRRCSAHNRDRRGASRIMQYRRRDGLGG
jgi:hypothetical protein